MQDIINGVRRFRSEVFPGKQTLFEELAQTQSPAAVMVSCADSRVDMQLVTQSEPGQLFGFRNAGNIVPPYGAVRGAGSATIEYALEALEIPDLIVCGHSDCGAMKGLLKQDLAVQMPTVAGWLRFAGAPADLDLRGRDPADPALVDLLVRANVLAQLEHLKTHPSVAYRLERGALRLHGWVYDIQSGEISRFDAERDRFVPLDEDYDVSPSASHACRAGAAA
jgi:carbonic anhydrase